MKPKTILPFARACLAVSLCICAPAPVSYANPQDSRELVAQAESGDAQAQLQLGLRLMSGQDSAPAPKQAVIWFEKAAEQGLHEASYQLGLSYEKGLGVEKNIPKALEHYERATGSRTSTWPQYRIAKIYLSGDGVTKSTRTAKEWAQTVVIRENPEGYYLMGEIYEDIYMNGDRQIRDAEIAIRQFRTAVEKGISKGQAKADELVAHLAKRFPSYKPKIAPNYVPKTRTAHIPGVNHKSLDAAARAMFVNPMYKNEPEKVDPQLPLAQLKEKAAARNTQAQLLLALRLLEKNRPEYDLKQGLKWMKQSANNDNARAQLLLGLIYHEGMYGQKEPRLGRHWLKKSAALGSNTAAGLLVRIIAEQRGVPQMSEPRAFHKRFADRGDAESQFTLGYMYREGKGGPVDAKEAAKWFRLAAEQGNPYAQSKLGFMYYKGIGVEADVNEALKWYQAAAEQGEANAQHNLGRLYYDGKGMPKNMDKAAHWNRKSANQMLPMGVFGMGVHYQLGLGVEQSLDNAYFWYHLSHLQGNSMAQKVRDLVGQGMTVEQRKGIEKLATLMLREWLFVALQKQ